MDIFLSPYLFSLKEETKKNWKKDEEEEQKFGNREIGQRKMVPKHPTSAV